MWRVPISEDASFCIALSIRDNFASIIGTYLVTVLHIAHPCTGWSTGQDSTPEMERNMPAWLGCSLLSFHFRSIILWIHTVRRTLYNPFPSMYSVSGSLCHIGLVAVFLHRGAVTREPTLGASCYEISAKQTAKQSLLHWAGGPKPVFMWLREE